MHLSKLLLNTRSRLVRYDLADRYEMHRTILSAFAVDLPDDERILFRVEDNRNLPVIPILVQSRYVPDWQAAERISSEGYLTEPPHVRIIVQSILTGQRLPFRLQANPTIKRNGKRHAIHAEADLMNWLSRQGKRYGFVVTPRDVQVTKLGKKYGQKRRQTWHAVQFDGVLDVTDMMAFQSALANGIGSAKAFGFGLLSVPYPSVT